MEADPRAALRSCSVSLDGSSLSFRAAVSPSHSPPKKTALRTVSCFTRGHPRRPEAVGVSVLNKAGRYGSSVSSASTTPLKLVCRVLTPAPRSAALKEALSCGSPTSVRPSPPLRSPSALRLPGSTAVSVGGGSVSTLKNSAEREWARQEEATQPKAEKPRETGFPRMPEVVAAGPRMETVAAREALLDPFLKAFLQLPPEQRPLDGFVDLASGPSLPLQRRSAARMSSRSGRVSHTRVFMSWATLVQRCDTQNSNLRDLNGDAVQVQQLLLQQVLSSTIPRNAFECLVSNARHAGSGAERLVEKRRIQNLIRRVKEHIEALSKATSPSTAGSEAQTGVSLSVSSNEVQSAARKQRSGERLSVSEFCAAMEKLKLWPRDMTASDHTEVAVAVALAGSTAADRERFVERRKISKDVSRTGFVRAFEFLPSNLPEWPVPLNKLPPPSVARRRLREECASTPLAWQQESAQKDEERQPLSVEHAAVEPVSLTQLEEALAEVAEGDEEALLRLDAQVLLERRNGEGTLADESSPARASRSDERLESSPLLGECVLVCRLALLLSYCFGLDVQRAFPGLRVRTSLNAKSGEGSPPTDGSQLGARPANEKCRGGGLSLLSNLLERSPYAAPSAPQPLSSCEVSLVPSWHCAQDYLASRLVTPEELQAALPCLVSVHWIRRAVRLMVGLTADAFSPAEWVRLLFPGSGGFCSDVHLSRVAERFNVLHAPLLLPKGITQTHQRLLFEHLQRQKTERMKERQAQLLLSSLQREREAKLDLLQLQRRLVKEEAVWRSKQTSSKLGIHWHSFKCKESIAATKTRQSSSVSAAGRVSPPNSSRSATPKGSRFRAATLPPEKKNEELASDFSLEALQLQNACRHLLSCVASSRAVSAFRRALAAAASASSSGNNARAVGAGEELAASAESAEGTFALDLLVLSQCAAVTLAVLQQPVFEPLSKHF